MDFKIEPTWDGFPVQPEPASVPLELRKGGVMLKLRAPVFIDPPAPLRDPGRPLHTWWDYEATDSIWCFSYLEEEMCGNENWHQSTRRRDQTGGRSLNPLWLFPPNVAKFSCLPFMDQKIKEATKLFTLSVPQRKRHPR